VVGFESFPAVGDKGNTCVFPDVSSGVNFGDDDEAPVGVATVVFGLRLELDYDAMMLDEAGFRSGFQSEIGASLGLPPSRIEIRSLSAGSILVEFAVLPSRNESTREYEASVESLMRQVLDPSSALRTSGTIGAAVDPTSLRIESIEVPVPPAGLSTLENSDFRHGADLGTSMRLWWFLSDAELPSTADAATARLTPGRSGDRFLHLRVQLDRDADGAAPWFSIGFNPSGVGMIGS